MNNEETMIMQPQDNKSKEQSTNKSKKEDKTNVGKHVAATAAAGVFGGAIGGAGSVVAATMLNNDGQEEEIVEAQVEEVEVKEESQEEAQAQAQSVEDEVQALKAELHQVKTELHEAQQNVAKLSSAEESQEPDYTNNNGADPVAHEAHVQQTSNDGESEVQVLGVYERYDENGTRQEMAIMTNGDEVAAVVDMDGDGTADVIGIDSNHNGQIEEGEIYDISDQHVDMNMYENAYLAQQQMEVEQHDTFAYNASDDTDYNNDAEMYDA